MADNVIGRGTVLAGRFRLEDLVNETDGAKFWRATDEVLARSVAVNVVDSTDPRAEAVLFAARQSATITDGHFLRVLDAAEEQGFVYVVNEWGFGASLDKMLAEGALPPRRAAWLVKEVAEAISTAHAHGIAHGRLIPENVMVTEAGSVKLIGFVVDAVLNGRQATSGKREMPLSDHEADILNLGALLYATLVGKWPGTPGTQLPEAPRDHGRLLRPRQVRAGVPRPLDAVCDRILNAGLHAHQPQIDTAHEVCAALADFIGDPAGVAQVGLEATTILNRDEFTSTGALSTGIHSDPEATQPGMPVADEAAGAAEAQPATPGAGARPASPATPATADPEATQAGAPVFHDDDTGAHWSSPTESRELRSTEGGSHRAAPPPPPPFPEPEERPLFAPGPPRAETAPRDPAPSAGVPDYFRDTRGSAHGTGSLPPVWGPDEPVDEPTGHGPARSPGITWLRLAGIVAASLLLVVSVIVAFNLGRGSGSGEQTAEDGPNQQSDGGGSAEPVSIAGVSDFDPQGDPPEENPELAELAADGDPGTAWKTMTYYNNPKLGLLKDGVGLVVDLGEPVDVSQVQLTLVGQPTNLELYATPEGQGVPEGVDGLDKVASANGAGPKVDLKLDQPATTQYLVVWLTSLPRASGGFQGQVAEVVVRP